MIRQDLSEVERIYQQQQANRYLQAGLTALVIQHRFDVYAAVCRHGRDCSIDINVIIEGDVILLATACLIGPNTLAEKHDNRR